MSLESQELKKHVGIIHCANHLTLLQRKISNALLYHAYDNLLTQDKYTIALGQLAWLVGYDSNDYEKVKKALKALISTVLEWNLLKDKVSLGKLDATNTAEKEYEKSWHASAMLASARIEGGMITYSYSCELRELLHMPEIYGRINLFVQAQFTSSYTLALYENCVRFRNLPYTRWFTIEIFRKLMGIEEGKYKAFRDIKRRVLDKAVSEINEISDIILEPELKRKNQAVVEIRFKITAKSGRKKLKPSTNLINIFENDHTDTGEDDLHVKLINEFGISDNHAKELLNKFGREYIEEKIRLIEQSSQYKNKQITSLGAYLTAAINKDYKQPKSAVATSSHATALDGQENEEKNKTLEREYFDYIDSMIDQSISKMSDERYAEFIKDFEDYIDNLSVKVCKAKYIQSGMNDGMVRAFRREFILKNRHLNFPNFICLDEYTKLRGHV